MTRATNATPHVGGVALHQTLITELPRLTAELTRHLARTLPDYARLPAEQLHGDVQAAVRSTLRMLAEILRTGRPPSEEHLEFVRSSAARRAEEGLPLDAVINAYHVGAAACLDSLTREAGGEDLRDVVALQRAMFHHLGQITAAVAAGYLDERSAEHSEYHAARDSLLSALLEGGDPSPHAARAGISLPAAYVALALTVSPHPDEQRPHTDPAIAARRKLRRLRAELDRRVGRGALLRLTADQGLALVPVPHEREDPEDPDGWPRLTGLVAGLADACGAPIVAGAQPCAPPGVPAAARLAHELRDLALIAGRPPGVYRLADLFLEHQLSRPGPAQNHLAALLAPVAQREDLLATLRAFLGSGLNRRRTATLLGVHPNTVDYRLGRVCALTGQDTSAGTGLLVLRAAVLAHDTAGRRGTGEEAAEA
ncbi:helix-turn-helix domain-containing protein [Streptomyces sp. DSM 44917]|uniref:Helix-turn-helix domain-containing protein n=1 Tax=Streptomyces boetiae TaxID=3075541 RepID=A0ABU2L4A8_9ACTN|nr:helix-turn-helix domain-containing protein [Streptomyces sp. DSM 44917]MDT0306399.1 helix-turn-helix domain-containing protein [Streptomyces sp. DSM 44917]